MKNNKIFLFSLMIGSAIFFAFMPEQESLLQQSIKRGKTVYEANCVSCHMTQGEGIDGVFPPLAKSDYMMTDKKRSIRQMIYGLKGKITVKGKVYDGEMPATGLNDKEIADVLNYVRNSWGNKGDIVTEAEVKAQRK